MGSPATARFDPLRDARLLALLDHPALFNLSQLVISGGQRSTKQRAKAWLNARPADRILDVGCGTGELAPLFRSTNDERRATSEVRYLGVDLNPQYIEYARQRYGAGGGVAFEVVNATRMAFAPGSFDRALFVNCLHHFPDELNRGILREIARVLRPGGRFVLIDMVGDHPGRAQRFFLDRDRGRHLRPLSAQRGLLAEFFTIERDDTFDAGFTPQTIIAARPKES